MLSTKKIKTALAAILILYSVLILGACAAMLQTKPAQYADLTPEQERQHRESLELNLHRELIEYMELPASHGQQFSEYDID